MANRGTKDMSYAIFGAQNGGGYSVNKSLYYSNMSSYGPRAQEASDGRLLEELELSRQRNKHRQQQVQLPTKDIKIRTLVGGKIGKPQVIKAPAIGSVYEQIHGTPKSRSPSEIKKSKPQKTTDVPSFPASRPAPRRIFNRPKPAARRVAPAAKKVSVFEALMAEVSKA